jgi:glycosyltransferase involved in cell wall biosynthesis
MPKPKLCLNMIVRNEESIIYDTLVHLYEKIPFDYWVISDTGSTDQTKEKIHEFAKKYDVLGEIYDDVWVDFGHNRTLALQHAYMKSDWLYMFDADDRVMGDFRLPNLDKADGINAYMVQMSAENVSIYYSRVMFINNHLKWKYVGVVHEYITLANTTASLKQSLIEGDYYILSGKHGDRSKSPEKYYLDALLLEKAYQQEIDKQAKGAGTELNLASRYSFYCGNSYFDYLQTNADTPIPIEKRNLCHEKIKYWYINTINKNDWNQEKYHSAYRLYLHHAILGQIDTSMYYLTLTLTLDPSRVEGAFLLIEHYINCRVYDLAYMYYKQIRGMYRNWMGVDAGKTGDSIFRIIKLFYNPSIYLMHFPVLILFLFKYLPHTPEIMEDIPELFRVIFTHQYTRYITTQQFQNVLNLIGDGDYQSTLGQHPELTSLMNEYLRCIGNVNTDVSLVPAPAFTAPATEKTLLFYTGTHKIPRKWNATLRNQYALGGSETAVVRLAQYIALQQPKWTVFVYGASVEPEQINNLNFIDKLSFPPSSLDWVIVSRQLDFYSRFAHLLKPDGNSIIMAHDTILMGITETTQLVPQPYAIVALTEWHKNLLQQDYPNLKAKHGWKIINNGIMKIQMMPGAVLPNRIPHSFVFTSRSERGLDKLLNLWPSILEYFPEASLTIAGYTFPDLPPEKWTPQNCEMDPALFEKLLRMAKNIQNRIGIMGAVSPSKLYELLIQMEIWFFPSQFLETSCVSAMEMLLTGVACFYYPIGGLPNTIGDNGFPIKEGQEILPLLDYYRKSDTERAQFRSKGQAYAQQQTWEARGKQWIELLHKEE